MGLAAPVPALDFPGRRFALHSSPHERVANLPGAQKRRDDVRQASERSHYKLEQLEACPDFAVRSDRWAGRGWIYSPHSCVVLPADDPEGEYSVGEQSRRDRVTDLGAAHDGFWRPVRPGRA